MQTIILIGHLILALVIVGLVLLQRSEGGALGIGGGNELQTGRKPTNPMIKLTAILGACFFVTSIVLTLLAQRPGSLLDNFQRPSDTLTIPKPPSDKGERK